MILHMHVGRTPHPSARVPCRLPRLHACEPLRRCCCGDVGVAVQVLHNLVGNACKFTKTGYVLIGVRYDSALRAVALSVSDTGCGIPSEALHTVFDAFTQGVHRSSEGLGLGLHLVVEFVKAHHGLIEVRSHSSLMTGVAHTHADVPIARCAQLPCIGVCAQRLQRTDSAACCGGSSRRLVGGHWIRRWTPQCDRRRDRHCQALAVVQVESEVGKGSTFTVWLPVQPDKRLLRTALVRLPLRHLCPCLHTAHGTRHGSVGRIPAVRAGACRYPVRCGGLECPPHIAGTLARAGAACPPGTPLLQSPETVPQRVRIVRSWRITESGGLLLRTSLGVMDLSISCANVCPAVAFIPPF